MTIMEASTLETYRDIYQGASDREIEVRMRLDTLYFITIGRVSSDDYQEMRELDKELVKFNNARRRAGVI